MESINNMAAAAAKAVWGENASKEEPVSGKTGDVASGEPYDAGNLGDENVHTLGKTSGSTAESAGTTSTTTTTTNAPPLPPPTATLPSPDAVTEGAAATSEPKSTKNEGTGGPAATTDSSVTAGDSSKAQNDVRDPTEPTTKPDTAAKKENVDDSQGLDKDENPAKVDGPGPKPVAELAKERGGDAGNVSGSSGADLPAAGSGAEKGDEEDDGPQSKSKGEGTGEKYVKSSGLNADGGDFDATKPGAGREADRLLEEKGITTQSAAAASTKAAASTSNESVDTQRSGGSGKDGKPKLTERIKEKLHIKKKDA